MNQYKSYYLIRKYNLQKLENIEDRRLIHQFENKGFDLNMDDLKDKYTLNQLR